MKFQALTVTALSHPTPQALTITLAPANSMLLHNMPENNNNDHHAHIQAKAGQHLSIEVDIDGQQYRRAYSLSSSPSTDNHWQITVKRVDKGVVSHYLHDHLHIGDQLRVSSPTGHFTPDIVATNHRSYYLFAAGSGITPLWSIAKTILTTEPYSYVYLLYGNRDEESIIFKADLDAWQQQYPKRFYIEHILTQPLSHQWSGLFKNLDYWKGKTGRIDSKALTTFINDYPPQAQRVRYLICGPGDMIPKVREHLISMDVDAADILFEYFGNPEDLSSIELESVATQLTMTIDGTQHRLDIPKDQSLLQGLLAQKTKHELNPDVESEFEVPYSCQSGVCGECKARLVLGKVRMKSHIALSESEKQNGDILTCQAFAQTSEICIQY